MFNTTYTYNNKYNYTHTHTHDICISEMYKVNEIGVILKKSIKINRKGTYN